MNKIRRIIVTSAGSPQSDGLINCLKKNSRYEILGTGSNIEDLYLSPADRKLLISDSGQATFKEDFLSLVRRENPSMIFVQHDREIYAIASDYSFYSEIKHLLYWPDLYSVQICLDKYKTWEKFSQKGIVVPKNIFLNSKSDLVRAFDELREESGRIWIRSNEVSGGGKGSKSIESVEEGCDWIDKFCGWGKFIAASQLTSKTVTWQSLWFNGTLVSGQARKRHEWAYSSLAASGVTGITKVCETVQDEAVTEVAMNAVKAINPNPHGVWGVDMTYDRNGVPNPTEINICRYFTTIQFYAEMGLNLPLIQARIFEYGFENILVEDLKEVQSGYLWIRGMDKTPKLIHKDDLVKAVEYAKNDKINL